MSGRPSANGDFNGPGTFRYSVPRARHENAHPLGPDRAEAEECRRLLGSAPVDRMVEEIEGYQATSAEELGALRDLELWGENPFELED